MNVVIIGCGNVGFELAKRLAATGHHRLLLVDRRRSEHVSELLRAHPASASFHTWDVMEGASALPIDADADVVVCTVGTLGTASPAEDFARFRSECELNYLGPLACVKRFLPRMLERRRGRFVIVTSTSGHHAARDLTAYSPSKWALEAALAVLGDELVGTGVELDVVSPFNIKNRWSDVFTFDFGVEPEVVAARIERCFGEAGHGRIFVPRRYEMLHLIERLSPHVLDLQAGLGAPSRRRASHRRQSAERIAVHPTAPAGEHGAALARFYREQGAIMELTTSDIVEGAGPRLVEAKIEKLVTIAEAEPRFASGVVATPLATYREALEVLFFAPVRLASALRGASTLVTVIAPPPIAPHAGTSASAGPLAALWSWTRALRRIRGTRLRVVEVLVAPTSSGSETTRAITAADRAGDEVVMVPRHSVLRALTAEALGRGRRRTAQRLKA